MHRRQRSVAPKAAPDASDSNWLKKLGPGLITGAADDDPSGIATYTQAGAQFGYGLGWTLLLTFPLMVGIQLASARIGRVTGKGLTQNFLRFCPRWLVISLVVLLGVANVVNLGADLHAMGDVTALVLGGSSAWFALGFGVVSLTLQVLVPYRRYVPILKWLTLSLLAYVAIVFVVRTDWILALKSTLIPRVQWNKDYLTTMVAILGTTISPYLFFWQATQEVEEIRRVPADQALQTAPEQARRQIRRMKMDTWIGMGFSNIVAFFIILSAAATLHAHGVFHIESTSQAASALQPIAGRFAFLLFGAGIVGTGLLALPVLAGSAADAIAGYFGWRKGLDLRWHQALAFYGVLTLAMGIGAVLGTLHLNPMRALFWAAVLNAVIAVPIMVAVMVAATRRQIMGDLVLSSKWRFAGWLATAVMAVATVAMFLLMCL